MRPLLLLTFALLSISLRAQKIYRVEINASANVISDHDLPFAIDAERSFRWLSGNGKVNWQGGVMMERGNSNTRFGIGLQFGYRTLGVRVVHGFDAYSPGGSHYAWPVASNFKGYYTTLGVPASLYDKIWSKNNLEAGAYLSLSVNGIIYHRIYDEKIEALIKEKRFNWLAFSAGPQLSWNTQRSSFSLRPQGEWIMTQRRDAYDKLAFLCTIAVSMPVGKTAQEGGTAQ